MLYFLFLCAYVLFQETASLVHGKIRCHKFVVAEHTRNTFVVKLTDPGIHKCYTSHE